MKTETPFSLQARVAVMSSTIRTSIRRFLEENFLFREGAAEISDSDSLLDSGIIDSAGVLSLVIFLEETFAIRVADDEVLPENLDSIEKLTSYVCRKTSTEPGTVTSHE
jgi:acyl carrier protein